LPLCLRNGKLDTHCSPSGSDPARAVGTVPWFVAGTREGGRNVETVSYVPVVVGGTSTERSGYGAGHSRASENPDNEKGGEPGGATKRRGRAQAAAGGGSGLRRL